MAVLDNSNHFAPIRVHWSNFYYWHLALNPLFLVPKSVHNQLKLWFQQYIWSLFAYLYQSWVQYEKGLVEFCGHFKQSILTAFYYWSLVKNRPNMPKWGVFYCAKITCSGLFIPTKWQILGFMVKTDRGNCSTMLEDPKTKILFRTYGPKPLFLDLIFSFRGQT